MNGGMITMLIVAELLEKLQGTGGCRPPETPAAGLLRASFSRMHSRNRALGQPQHLKVATRRPGVAMLDALTALDVPLGWRNQRAQFVGRIGPDVWECGNRL